MHITKTYINEIKDKIYSKIYHSYLSKEIDLPKIDEDKLYLLLSIIETKNIPVDEKENLALTVMFIQIALDTHDLVKNDDEEIKSKKEQQLLVLAGDYYSGLYYRTLSLIPDIHLIKCLAGAIKIVNENKIKIYRKEINSFDEFMASMQQIETAIYQKLAQYLKAQQYEIISSEWLHLNQMIKDKEKYIKYILNNKNTLKMEFQSEHIIDKMDRYIEKVKSQLVQYAEEQLDVEKFIHITSRHEQRYDSSIVQ